MKKLFIALWYSFKIRVFLRKELLKRRIRAARSVLFDEEYLVITNSRSKPGNSIPNTFSYNMTPEKVALTTGFIYKRTQGQLDTVAQAKAILKR